MNFIPANFSLSKPGSASSGELKMQCEGDGGGVRSCGSAEPPVRAQKNVRMASCPAEVDHSGPCGIMFWSQVSSSRSSLAAKALTPSKPASQPARRTANVQHRLARQKRPDEGGEPRRSNNETCGNSSKTTMRYPSCGVQ
jgi:hypothetical protein